MKNFEITFKNGLLIDTKTGNVLNLNPQANYTIQGDDNNFLLDDFKKVDYTPLNASEKIEKLSKKYKGYQLEKIAAKNDEFYFRIGLGKRTKEDKEKEYLFNAILEEDLYLKSKNGTVWTMCQCVCRSSKIIEGELGFPFQTVVAQTLSELFANVVSTYFNQKRSTACNAFKTFHSLIQNEVPSLDWIKSKKNTVINLRRKAKVLNLKLGVLKL